MQLATLQLYNRSWRVLAFAMLGVLISGCDRTAEIEATPVAEDSASALASGASPDSAFSAESFEDADPSSLREALRIPDPLLRIERVSRFLQQAKPDRLAEIKAEFEGAVLDAGDSEYVLFGVWWAGFDPRRAYKYSLGEEIRAEHPRLRLAIARTWARMDAAAAVDSGLFADFSWNSLGSQGAGFAPELLDAIVVGWFESGKPGLEEFVSGLTAVSDVTQGVRTYARLQVIRKGARETLEWTRETTAFPEAHRRLLLAGALTIIAHQDPELAVEWLAIAEADGIDTRTFPMRIAGSWGHHDPLKAFEWIKTLPEGADQNKAARRAGLRWRETDSKGLASWLSQQVGDEWLDPLRLLTIRTDVYRSDYQVDWLDILERSQELADEQKRKNQVIWVLQQWNFLDPDAADAWMDERRDQFTENELSSAHEISMGEKKKIERLLAERKRRES